MALERSRARRERDDRAPRLKQLVPEIDSLSLEVCETPAADSGKKSVQHVRRVVVDHAPARFALPCCDPRCDGEHDLTDAMLAALFARQPAVSGRHRCAGSSKAGRCSFELAFVASASYRDMARGSSVGLLSSR